MDCVRDESGEIIACSLDDRALERLCVNVVNKRYDPSLPFVTESGSFFIGDTDRPLVLNPDESDSIPYDLGESDGYRSLMLIPISLEGSNEGMLLLKSREKSLFTRDQVQFYEVLIQPLGVAIAHRRAQLALRERIKELTCLNGIAKLVATHDLSTTNVLESIAALLPPAWLYPEIASARILLDDRSYATSDFGESPWKLGSDIVIDGVKRGRVEVVYGQEKPELDEGPFLKEERDLIDTIARELSVIVKQKQSEDEKSRLKDQLRHADRLATIGQLAAGIAHELNEPLGTILGFAQLTRKQNDLPTQVDQDLEKIANAALFAREVIRKLMTFARRMPPKKTHVDLNEVVKESLDFFISRASKAGVELRKELSERSPVLTADPAQLTQVLINLVVNALQAMPEGGTLTVRTSRSVDDRTILLEVADTGMGMTEDVQKQVFLPFFTTKDIHEGTGLGLAVVHGIVVSHGGTVTVESRPGEGSVFRVRLPVTSNEGGNHGG
jgi:signal transduction histidine kinase